ncbi:36 kDa membrane antigen [Serratia fonticola]|uniref:36 kDa membrane antigen n=1 Tax=Serratia fonticola TaxID=47917 RepID=A0A4U9UVC3_SERFO|nr:36 kDa membrane antigen [Serratia fonticola]
MDENYLQVYEDAVGKYTGFFDDVNNVLGSMHKHLSTSESGKIFIESEFRDAVGETLRKWERDNVLIDGLNPSEATAWAESIGPLAYADGTKVKIDLSALRELQTTVYDSTGDWMSAHEFQAVNEALSVHKEKIQSNMQTLIQKYSTANSTLTT